MICLYVKRNCIIYSNEKNNKKCPDKSDVIIIDRYRETTTHFGWKLLSFSQSQLLSERPHLAPDWLHGS